MAWERTFGHESAKTSPYESSRLESIKNASASVSYRLNRCIQIIKIRPSKHADGFQHNHGAFINNPSWT